MIETPSADSELGIIGKTKKKLFEMYLNEYYEALSKNFVKIADEKGSFYIFYNHRPILGHPSSIIDKKLLDSALSGTEIDIHILPGTTTGTGVYSEFDN